MPKEIRREEVRKMVAAGAQLVEVLPSPDYEEDHLPGAVHLPLRKLDSEARTVLVVACALPYANITDNSVSQTTPSIFNPGYPGALWYAVEPVAVAALGIAAGVMLIALRGSHPAGSGGGGAARAGRADIPAVPWLRGLVGERPL